MQDTELVIDEEYINEMAEYFEKQGKQLQNIAASYIGAMKRVVGEGIIEGKTSETLKTFLEYAEKLNQVIISTAMQIRDSAMNYLEEIDTQDQYLY